MILFKVRYMVRDDGTKNEIEFRFIKKVAKGTFPNWHSLFGRESERAQEICEQ